MRRYIAILMMISGAVMADFGTPYKEYKMTNGTLRIEAEDFNNGGTLVAYKVTTAGNQGGDGYRAGDVDTCYSNGIEFIRSSAGQGGAYELQSGAMATASEYMNYAFTLSQTGWYKVVIRCRSSSSSKQVSIPLACINDRELGSRTNRDLKVGTQWQSATVIDNIYLTATNHNLKVVVESSGTNTVPTDIDYIDLFTVSSPTGLINSVVNLGNGELVLASANVTNAPFYADKTGGSDCTAAFQAAMDMVCSVGGGIVFAPAGKYRFAGNLVIPANVTLAGYWLPPWPKDFLGVQYADSPTRDCTVLMPYAGRGDESEDGTPFIKLLDDYPVCKNATIRNLAIWYPQQDATNIVPYPYTIRSSPQGDGFGVINITLYNSYQGIRVEGGLPRLSNIYGTVLRRGALLDGVVACPFLLNVRFTPNIWINAPVSRITNAPSGSASAISLQRFVSDNLDGLQLGRVDAARIYGVTVDVAKRGVIFKKETTNDFMNPASVMCKIDADMWSVDSPFRADSKLHYAEPDLIPETGNMNYYFAGVRSADNRPVNVRSYGAKGDGSGDDTTNIQAALNAASTAGGGIVYFPQGIYPVKGNLNVPAGVEILGCYGDPFRGNRWHKACVIDLYAGSNSVNPESATAAVTLNANSGIRNIGIRYPEQSYASLQGVPYPFTIRGNGSNIWVNGVTIENPYNAIDFKTYRCDNFLVRDVGFGPLNIGLAVGGGSTSGKIEQVWESYTAPMSSFNQNSPWFDVTWLDNEEQALSVGSKIFEFSNCSNITSMATAAFQCGRFMRFYDSGGFPKNMAMWCFQSDGSEYGAVFAEAGGQIDLIGATGGHVHDPGCVWFETTSNFTGSINVYGTRVYADGGTDGDRYKAAGGTVKFFQPETLIGTNFNPALRLVDSLGSVTEAYKTVDRDDATEWVLSANKRWVEYDLGQPCEMERWQVRNSRIYPAGNPDYNTVAAGLWLSNTSLTNYTKLDSFNGPLNAPHQDIWDLQLQDTNGCLVFPRGRYVKLDVTKGASTNVANIARIRGFNLYGRAGWHFRCDGEGWTSGQQISSVTFTNDRVVLNCSGSGPYWLSADNLGIDLDRFGGVWVAMRNETSSIKARMYFTTVADQDFSDAKSLEITITANDGIFTDYGFDFATNTYWTGTLKRLRLIPVDQAGKVVLESIEMIP